MKFMSANDLKNHNNSHKGEKSHVCEVCGKAFVRQDALKIHMRVSLSFCTNTELTK